MQFENIQQFVESISGAEYVQYREPLLFVWNGAHTVRIFVVVDDNAEEVDIMSIGDFTQNAATLAEVEESIETYLQEQTEEMEA